MDDIDDDTMALAGDGFYGRNATALAAAEHSVPARVTLRAEVLVALRSWTAAAAPDEAGGALGGRRRGAAIEVVRFVHLRNTSPSTDRYVFDPIDLLRAEAGLRAQGLSLSGFAHSHPGGTCAPSAVDLREAWRHHLHLIAAPHQGLCPVRAWWCLERGFVPLPLVP